MSTKNTIKRKHGKPLNERGNALVMVVIGITAILGMSGLVLDWGRGVWTRSQMQKAADAGALSGASELPSAVQADINAQKMVDNNYADSDEVKFSISGDNYTVVMNDTIPTYFMRIFGESDMDIGVKATAISKMEIGGLNGGGFPFAVINPNKNNDSTDDLVPGNYGKRYVIGYGEDNIILGDWANGSATMPKPNKNDGGRGWRGALELNDDGTIGGGGASDLRNNIVGGWPGEMHYNDTLPTLPGNMTTIRSAVVDKLGANPIPWANFDSVRDVRSSRVILVPIVHVVHPTRGDEYTMADYNAGTKYDQSQVVIDGFAPFFLLSAAEQGDVDGDGKGNDTDWITGYYIGPIQINNYLPPVPGSENFGMYSTPRLVD